MTLKNKVNEELKALSPFLYEIKERNPGQGYSVPPGYFEQLEENTMQRLDAHAAPAKQKPVYAPAAWLWERIELLLQPRYALALASVLLLAAGGYLLRNTWFAPEPCLEIACLDQEELLAYLQNHAYNLNTDLIIEAGISDAGLEAFDIPLQILEENSLDPILLDILETMDIQELEPFY